MAAHNRFVLSLEADQDLEDIFDYTFDEFGLDQAIKYVSEFEDFFNLLIHNPDIGKHRDEIKEGLRSFPKASHIIFYRVLIDHVRIVRILHARLDIPRYFLE